MAYNYDGFYPANIARDIAVGNRAGAAVVLSEINALQVAIDIAAVAGDMKLEVANSTSMTTYDNYDGANSSSYYDAWVDINQYQDSVHITARERMSRVIAYFTRLGYSIGRDRDGLDNRLKWILKW